MADQVLTVRGERSAFLGASAMSDDTLGPSTLTSTATSTATAGAPGAADPRPRTTVPRG
jgi:hypothetical protein